MEQIIKEALKTGTISEEELVNIFATNSAKQKWSEQQSFKNKTAKNTVLDKARRYCQITDNKNQTYTIYRIYQNPLPAKWSKMNDGLYKYIIPLLLDVIDSDGQPSTIFTIGKWARAIDLVNPNYYIVKDNKEDYAPDLNIDYKYVYDFYNHVDDMLSYYIKTALDYLKSATCVLTSECFYACFETGEVQQPNQDGYIEHNLKTHIRMMTKEEVEFYAKCVEETDKAHNIINEQERYYSNRAAIWHNTLNRKLYKERRIKFVFKSYMVTKMHEDRRKYIRSLYGTSSGNTLRKRLSTAFSEKIIDNADKRFAKDYEKMLERKYDDVNAEGYHDIFDRACKILVLNKAKLLDDFWALENEANKYKLEGNITYES